jgi:peptidoglycan/LPS O-acetylase OafA/YrhL
LIFFSSTTQIGGPDRRLPGLDLLRTIAILLVIFWHLPWANLPHFLWPIKKVGWTGVDLFFVLSGYLIGSQLLRSYAKSITPSFSGFYFRRAMRVMPAYLVVLALYFVFPAFREQPNISPLWRFLTFTQNFGLKIHEQGAFSHAWSLCVEEHFYLLLPIVLFALFKRPSLRTTSLVVCSILLGGFVIRWSLWTHYLTPSNVIDSRQLYLEKIYYPTYTRLDGLLAGVALAAIQWFRPEWWDHVKRRGDVLLGGGLAVVLAAYPIYDKIASKTTALWGYPLLAVGFGLLVAAGAGADGVIARYRVWGTSTIAALAYSIYLTHKEVMALDQKYFGTFLEAHVVLGTAIYAISIIAAALLLYVCVERPFLRLRESVRRPAKAVAMQAYSSIPPQ